MSDPLTKPTDEFDLDAWISGAKLPERSVTVYGRADLVAEFEGLEERLHAIKDDEPPADRLGVTSESVRIAGRMESLRQEMKGSALTFRFRALTRDEQKAITDAAPKGKDGEPDQLYVAANWIAKACISPGMTAAQAEQMRPRLGEGQYASLWDTAWTVSNAKHVDVPFSLAASGILSTQDS